MKCVFDTLDIVKWYCHSFIQLNIARSIRLDTQFYNYIGSYEWLIVNVSYMGESNVVNMKSTAADKFELFRSEVIESSKFAFTFNDMNGDSN